MHNTRAFILRIFLVLVLTVILSYFGIIGSTNAVQALFTVLGISFSISMSLIISFDLSQVLNDKYRNPIRNAITNTRNGLILDFAFSTLILLLASIQVVSDYELQIKGTAVFYFQTFAICVIAFSIFYEAYNFTKIHNLQNDITDAIIKEKNGK